MEASLATIQKSTPAERDYVEQDRLVQHLAWARAEVAYVALDRSVVRDPRNAGQTGQEA